MSLQNYQILERIGKGKYCSVYKVRRLEDARQFALKRVNLNALQQRARRNALAEVKLLRMIHNENIVQLVEAFSEDSHTLCLILELAEEGDLGELISRCQQSHSRLGEEELWNLAQQISSGLAYLHVNNILHRDIKPTNILRFKGQKIKISDFNVSKVSDHLAYTRTGTLSYASPEIWLGLPYDAKSDIWSFGCLLYELACMRKPFSSDSVEELYKKVTKCQFTKMTAYSRELRDLITFMMQSNPKLRPSASTILRMCLNRKNGKSLCLSRTRGTLLTPNFKESRFQLNHSSLSSSHDDPPIRQRLYTQISKKNNQAVTLRKTNQADFEEKLEKVEVGLKRSERTYRNCFDSPQKTLMRRQPPRVLPHRLEKLSVINRPRRNTDI